MLTEFHFNIWGQPTVWFEPDAQQHSSSVWYSDDYLMMLYILASWVHLVLSWIVASIHKVGLAKLI